MLAISNLRNEN